MKRKRVSKMSAVLVVVLLQLLGLVGPTVRSRAVPLDQAEFACTGLDPLPIATNTGEKPQSKVWTYAGEWWSVLPSTSASSSGTWLWKLQGTTWVEVLKLSSETGTKADVKSVGDVAHILLYDSSPELVSVEYVGGTYQLWSLRPAASPISLPNSEIATIDIDSTGRMWLATESGTDIVVYYSDSPYSTWNGPQIISLSSINTDDISVVTAMPDDTIGVLWSDQADGYFHFRTHADGADPAVWSSVENVSAGTETADDHVNVAVASDGTLYAAVKTEPTGGNANLLVRRPGGTWDSIYQVDTDGTRPIVVLNEVAGMLRVIYTSATGGGSIIYKETALSSIDFSGPASTLIGGSFINDASSTKQNYVDELVVIASDSSNALGVFCTSPDPTLVAHYEMEEGSGTDLVDSSSYGNDGTLYGDPAWETSQPGLGLDLDLDGTGDYALVPDDPSLDIEDEITLAAWVKPEKVGTQYLIKKATQSGVNGYELSLASSGYAFVRFNQAASGNTYRLDSTLPYSTTGSTWNHLAATYDGSEIKLYVNGVLDPDPLSASLTIATNSLALAVGAQSDGTTPFQGQMDEVRVYNRALSATEIEALATLPSGTADLSITKDDGLTTANPEDPTTYTIAVSNDGPDDVTGATVTDDFSTDLTGVTWTCSTTGGASCTASGSGDIDDAVDLPSGSSATYTVNATFDAGAVGTIGNTASVAPPAGVTDPDMSNNAATDTTDLPPGDPPVAHYEMEEGSGTTLVDSSTYGNDGTLLGTPAWATSQAGLGLALDLDGSTQNGLVPDDPSLDIENAITLAAWVKPTKSAAATQYLIKKATQDGVDGYELSLASSGKAFVRFNQATSGNTYRRDSTTSYPVAGSAWVHLAATYDGSVIKLYFNGVQEGGDLAGPTAIATNALSLGIGAQSDGGSKFQGQMDEVRIYNRALSATEIEALATLPTPDTADLAISKDDGQTTATPGDPVAYTIVVSNNGPDPVTGATVTDTFSTDLTGVTWTCAVTGGASCTASGSGDIDDTVDLPVGDSVTYTVNATFDAGATGPLINTASVALPTGMTDPDPDNNSATDFDLPSAWADQCGADSSLVGCWLMEEAGGATIYDSSGYGNHGTLYNDATRVAGQPGLGQALALDGTGDYALVPDDNSLDLDTNLTIAAWVKPEKVDTQDLVKKALMGDTDGYELTLATIPSAVSPEGDGRPFARFNEATNGNTYRINALTQYPVSGADWIHLAVSFDGANMRLYYNGVLESTLPAAISIATNDLPLSIGAQSDGTRAFQGQVDEVRVYNRTLSLNEIEVLAGLPPSDSADLAITKDDGLTTADPGDPTAYTIVVTNDGPDGVTGAAVTDSFPTELTGVTWTCTGAGGASCTASGSGDINDTVDLPNGSSVTYTVNATFDLGATGDVSNTASVAPPAGVNDPDTGNNSATDVTDLGTPETDYALDLGASNAYVHFGDAAALDLPQFTLETWFRRDGAGVPNTTGTGGFANAIPLISNGAPEAETIAADMNYLLCINDDLDVIGADFEEGADGASPSQNHPVSGVTPIVNGTWYHAAVTYDGSTLRLYLNGNLEAAQVIGEPANATNNSPNSLGTMLRSDDLTRGFFDGVLDEVRIWDYARTHSEIFATINSQIDVAQAGLVGRWALDENGGTTAVGSAGTTVDGTINGTGYAWVGPAPFDIAPPAAPAAPSDLTATAPTPFSVELGWTDNADSEFSFEIERSTDGSGGPFSLLDTVAANTVTYVDSTASPETEYCYRVRATNVTDNSAYSNVDCALTPAEGEYALDLGAGSAYVSFGPVDELKLAQFTLEGWFKREGAGTTASTGTGGVVAVPLITKGRGEGDGSNLDMNYFLGIRGSDGVLCADFEEGATGSSPGLNHPVCGTTAILNDTWYHVAVTYDGTTWYLYLDGALEAFLTVGEPLRSDSIQHAGLGTAMTSVGTASGHFDGVLDEVRIWDYARTHSEIFATINSQIDVAQAGLVGRWALDENGGTTAVGSAGTTVDGTINGTGYAWVGPAPFDIAPPAAPAAPTDLAATALTPFSVELGWTDNADSEFAFEIERSTDGSDGPFSLLDTVAANTVTYVDSTASPETEYCYRVRATNVTGNSAYSNVDCALTPAEGEYALQFDGSDDYVTFGPNLNASSFTLEAWVKRDSGGSTMSTGTNGLDGSSGRPYVYPVLTKGMGQGETPANINMNWFLGIADTGVVGADFEDNAGGGNHPAWGTTVVPIGEWHHIAATYDGSCWSLYLDGNLDTLDGAVTECPGATPESTSIQHAGLAAGLGSTGQLAAGFFAGTIDEARVWNVARSQQEIADNFELEITSDTGLIGRWGLNEGTGTTVGDSSGSGVDGTATNGPVWVTPGSPFAVLLVATFQDGLDGYTGTRDTYIWDVDPDTPRGGETTMVQDKNTSDDRTSLLLFDLSSIPTNATILSSELQFYVDTEGQGFNMYRMFVSWDEATVTYNSIGGRHFAADDIDAESSVDANWPGDDGYTGYIYVSVPPSTIQEWVDGTLTNNGWLMIATHESDGQQLRTREHATQEHRPKLTVSYRLPPPSPPDAPVLVQPADTATDVSTSPTLEVTVSDPDGDLLDVTFYGRPATAAAGPDFTVVALPDTQYYTVNTGGDAIFEAQTNWAVNQETARNIVYVTHLGDITENGDNDTDDSEWIIADAAMDILEKTTDPADDIPYGVTPGNHDLLGGATRYETWFGVSRFSGRTYYGGHYGADNRNSYCLFSASGMDFIMINIDSGSATPTTGVLDWADALLKADPDRRGIVTCHQLINTGNPGSFTTAGGAIYNALKDNPNLFLMLGGHVPGVGQRTDLGDDGHTIYSLLADYQSETNGGNGYLRIMTFSPIGDEIQVTTYSPTLDSYKTDAGNQFTLSYDMSGDFTLIGTNTGVASGSTTSMTWPGRDPDTEYEWYVTVSDGSQTTTGPVWSFTTASSIPYDLGLSPGWNLVSWPLAPLSEDLNETLDSCSACDEAWAYDAGEVTEPWKHWPGDLSQVDETMGLWLHVTEPVTLTVTGWPPGTTDIELHEGWNLVGYPSQTARLVADALDSIDEQYSQVRTFDVADAADPWKQYKVGVPAYANDLATMQPGRGYWIYATEACILSIAP